MKGRVPTPVENWFKQRVVQRFHPPREALYAIEELTGSSGAVLGSVPKRTDDAGFNLAGHFTDEQCATYTDI